MFNSCIQFYSKMLYPDELCQLLLEGKEYDNRGAVIIFTEPIVISRDCHRPADSNGLFKAIRNIDGKERQKRAPVKWRQWNCCRCDVPTNIKNFKNIDVAVAKAIHYFLYHPKVLSTYFNYLRITESQASSSFPYLHFAKSSVTNFTCFICLYNFANFDIFLDHAIQHLCEKNE